MVLAGIKDANGTVYNQQLAVKIIPLKISIKGDKVAYLHKMAHWAPEINGGELPITVIWGMKKEGDQLFWPIANNYLFDYQPETEGVYYLRVWVKDKNGISAQSEDFKFTALYQPPYIVIKGPKEVPIGEEILLSHTLEGGKGPFKYQWKLFNVNDDFVKILSYSEAALFTPTWQMKGNNTIKLEVKDLYNNKTFYTQHFIKVTPMNTPGEGAFIAPNPSKNTTTLTYYLAEAAQVAIKVYDSQGNLVFEPKNIANRIGENKLNVDISTWKADTYLVKITIQTPSNSKYETIRLVVQ